MIRWTGSVYRIGFVRLVIFSGVCHTPFLCFLGVARDYVIIRVVD